MERNQDIRQGRHCVFNMHVHLVFVAKYRRKIFDSDALDRLKRHFARVAGDFGATLISMEGERDHVHLLLEYPPKASVSNIVRSLKGVSARMLRQERLDLEQHYWQDQLWSPSYFAASCGGAPLEIIKEYIDGQQRPA